MDLQTREAWVRHTLTTTHSGACLQQLVAQRPELRVESARDSSDTGSRIAAFPMQLEIQILLAIMMMVDAILKFPDERNEFISVSSSLLTQQCGCFVAPPCISCVSEARREQTRMSATGGGVAV